MSEWNSGWMDLWLLEVDTQKSERPHTASTGGRITLPDGSYLPQAGITAGVPVPCPAASFIKTLCTVSSISA